MLYLQLSFHLSIILFVHILVKTTCVRFVAHLSFALKTFEALLKISGNIPVAFFTWGCLPQCIHYSPGECQDPWGLLLNILAQMITTG